MSVEEQLRIAVREGADRLVVVLDGDLDLVSSAQLQETVDGFELDGLAAVVVDLRGVDFLDSAGLKAIFKLRNAVHAGGREFAVTRGSAQVQRLLELTRLDEHLRTIDTPEAALT